jgi:hypothetical protein
MIYNIETQSYPMSGDFSKGTGFYLVKYPDGLGGWSEELHFYNTFNNMTWMLGRFNELPVDFIEYLKHLSRGGEEIEERMVSEKFALKMLIFAQGNHDMNNTNDILNG